MSALNDKVIELRNRTGLSIKDFCEKFKLKYLTVKRWEDGLVEPKIYTVYMINIIINCEEKFGPINVKHYWNDSRVNLKYMRNCTGLSRREFSNKFKMRPNTYAAWEYGGSAIPVHVEYMLEIILTYVESFDITEVVPNDECYLCAYADEDLYVGGMSKRIIKLRERSGLTQEEFSEKFRIEMLFLSRWESGTEPVACVPFMLEKLMDYEEKFGAIDYIPETYDLGGHLRSLKERTGLSSPDFFHKFRIHRATYSSWNVGRTQPTHNIVYMVEALLNYESKFGEIPDPEWSADI